MQNVNFFMNTKDKKLPNYWHLMCWEGGYKVRCINFGKVQIIRKNSK